MVILIIVYILFYHSKISKFVKRVVLLGLEVGRLSKQNPYTTVLLLSHKVGLSIKHHLSGKCY